jgi:hypothetical protein
MTYNHKMKAQKTNPIQAHFRSNRCPKVSSRTQSATHFVQNKAIYPACPQGVNPVNPVKKPFLRNEPKIHERSSLPAKHGSSKQSHFLIQLPWHLLLTRLSINR